MTLIILFLAVLIAGLFLYQKNRLVRDVTDSSISTMKGLLSKLHTNKPVEAEQV